MILIQDESMEEIYPQKFTSKKPFVVVWKRLKKNRGAMIGLVIVFTIVLSAVLAGALLDYDTDVIGLNMTERLQGPSFQHPFGTDELGRDLFARVAYGARYSLLIGIVSIAISLFFGVLLGSVSGYFGGVIDEIIMRVSDALASIPNILMAIAIVSVLGQGTGNLMLAIGLTNVPQFVRITRASVLIVRNQEYIEASSAIGLSNWKIIWGHVLPNCLSPIIVQVTLRIASAIISASSLSFLGLGVQAPAPEWGGLLAAGRKYIRGYGYLTFFPGLAIMLTVLGLNMFGDGLRDALDPKLKK